MLVLYYSASQAIKDETKVIDVDDSYLYKKSKYIQDSGTHVAPLNLPSAPIIGWETITKENASDMAKNIPSVTSGVIYTYLSTYAGHDKY